MRTHRVVQWLVALAFLLTSAFNSPAALARGQGHHSPDAVLAWNTHALYASITVANQFPVQSLIYMALTQAAVYNAVVAIDGRYEPYQQEQVERQPWASVNAAVATAAHAVLVHYIPARQAISYLDAQYAAALAAIPDGRPKQAGIKVGQTAADNLIALRQGDGLEADIGFVMPAAGPGVWQLLPGQTPVTPWVSQLRPFTLKSPDQFRPGPPPSLNSPEWTAEYDEIKAVGQDTSPLRTAEQTDVARFWSLNFSPQYNNAFQKLVRDRKLDAVDAARLLAMGNVIGADAGIACWDAKYHYLFWRPVGAIQFTVGNDTWKPLLPTPAHPEYPSGHSCVTGALAKMLAAFLGTNQIECDISSSAPGLIHPSRHYVFASDLTDEIINARVWSGIHYRGSDVTGVEVGRQVAQWALQHYFLPEDQH